MGRYDPLRDALMKETQPVVTYSFERIESIIGGTLPGSAYKYSWWWDNEDLAATQHTQCPSQSGGSNRKANRPLSKIKLGHYP